MTLSTLGDTQDFHDFIDAYRRQYPDDVLTVRQSLSADQDVTALVDALASPVSYTHLTLPTNREV